ncbi:hypothetical protein FEM48_Zijuj08G0200400 [Ziziphus jujuba var. spinosa]|uniref:Retrotransposon gag domain-containing protein n=1 Tax=Ziziphus jujuba var. spinosa TaxID=714518 RepID=A0A978V137_ZIZJJ|nr:hypothetical protein FEM48_Zijuj08G0200400 [Ziziphus jujuba var. spinosa]
MGLCTFLAKGGDHKWWNSEEHDYQRVSPEDYSSNKPDLYSYSPPPTGMSNASKSRIKLEFPRVALQWYRWVSKFKGSVTWAEFTKAILYRFGLTDYDNPLEAFPRLKQTSIVDQYQTKFENLSQRIEHLPKPFLVAYMGSAHNFINLSLVNQLGIPMDKSCKLPVMVANGDRLECSGKCRNLTLKIENYSIYSDFYILPAATCQVILGIQWIEMLRPIEIDYRQLTMKFSMGSIPYKFQGIRRVAISTIVDGELCRVDNVAYFLVIFVAMTTPIQESHLVELTALLSEFREVFSPLTEPPPCGTEDYAIPLLLDQASFNI